jgi:hypothetical protein
LSVVWTAGPRTIAAKILVLELMCESIRDVVEAAWRTKASANRTRRERCARRSSTEMLIWIGVVVEVPLVRYTTGRLLRTPKLLLADWLRESRGRSREGAAAIADIQLVAEAEVEVETIGVAVVLLLVLVCHGGRGNSTVTFTCVNVTEVGEE